MNKELKVIARTDESTVIALYDGLKRIDKSYQSESELENELIDTLKDMGYEYVSIHNEDDLISNLRCKLSELNNYNFTDNEWNYLFNNIIANKNDGVLEKTKTIQKDEIKILTLDDGTSKNIRLIDKDNIYNNKLQVINQYVNDDGNYKNRYDVTILVNGLPLVHIELKRRGVSLRNAFDQIDRYRRDSFWSGSGLYEYIQIFIISNGTYTKYYSNTTRLVQTDRKTRITRDAFEFTSYWADQENNAIIDLIDFAKTFLSKHTILNILTKYCVFTTDNNLMVLRPYQIVATERILNRIELAHNYKYYGTTKSGGYIWHTTGSGKTLTSFKTAQLATNLPYIDKVLFVVDRKDLDYQTMKEYDSFEKNCANSNSSTKILERQLSDNTSKIIITTIQKLSSFIKKNSIHDVYNKHIVFIFDECHRSQFGDMHNLIIKKFKKYYLFGFTGTPIFSKNAKTKQGITLTTEQVFGESLHRYTIVDAINDKNVLPFKYQQVGKYTIKDGVKDEQVEDIDRDKEFKDIARINMNVGYIVDNFNRVTKCGNYMFNKLKNITDVVNSKKDIVKKNIKEVSSDGFNSILAVSDIEMAKLYYDGFKRYPNNLKIALIYSYGVNNEDIVVEENSESAESLSKPDRDYLESAIKDYNEMFNTSYDTSSEKFQNYYKDVSLRMKNKDIDILIVVNMFLTGFDAKTLNTLWVDKNLNYHGLIQAFSRTNRILNNVKSYGNIVSFRNLETNLNEALGLFGDKNASGIVLLKSYEDYYYGYKETDKEFLGYKTMVDNLTSKYPVGEPIVSVADKKQFIKDYGSILRVMNILSSFDEFEGNQIFEPRDIQDYNSMYLNIKEGFTPNPIDKEDITDDIEYEMELIKTIDITIDYILDLVKKYHESNMEDKELLVTINRTILSSPELRNKKDLIDAFIASLNADSNVYEDFEVFVNSKKKEELDKIIEEENLNKDETYKYIRRVFDDGYVEVNGTSVADILPPMSRFTKDAQRSNTKERVINRLISFFDKFFSITNNKF